MRARRQSERIISKPHKESDDSMGDNVLRSISVGSDLLNLDSIQESLKQIDEVVKDIPEYDPATNGGEEVVTI